MQKTRLMAGAPGISGRARLNPPSMTSKTAFPRPTPAEFLNLLRHLAFRIVAAQREEPVKRKIGHAGDNQASSTASERANGCPAAAVAVGRDLKSGGCGAA